MLSANCCHVLSGSGPWAESSRVCSLTLWALSWFSNSRGDVLTQLSVARTYCLNCSTQHQSHFHESYITRISSTEHWFRNTDFCELVLYMCSYARWMQYSRRIFMSPKRRYLSNKIRSGTYHKTAISTFTTGSASNIFLPLIKSLGFRKQMFY